MGTRRRSSRAAAPRGICDGVGVYVYSGGSGMYFPHAFVCRSRAVTNAIAILRFPGDLRANFYNSKPRYADRIQGSMMEIPTPTTRLSVHLGRNPRSSRQLNETMVIPTKAKGNVTPLSVGICCLVGAFATFASTDTTWHDTHPFWCIHTDTKEYSEYGRV